MMDDTFERQHASPANKFFLGDLDETEVRRLIPVFINSYNQLTYLRDSVGWLHKYGFRNITVLDNNSTFPPLLEYFASADFLSQAAVVHLGENLGPRRSLALAAKHPSTYGGFIFTDPDLALPEPPAPDMLKFMFAVGRRHGCVKVGLALSLDPEIIDLNRTAYNTRSVRQVERNHWRIAVEPGIFRSPTDTTFFLYVPQDGQTKKFNDFGRRQARIPAIRIGKPGFLAIHRPWLFSDDVEPSESQFYIENANMFSTYAMAQRESDTKHLSRVVEERETSTPLEDATVRDHASKRSEPTIDDVPARGLAKVFFTVTPGRSGTTLLTNLLATLPEVVSEHEPKPSFRRAMRPAQSDASIAKKFLEDIKLPSIRRLRANYYVETSHVFCKGFFEPMLRSGEQFGIIVLRRSPREVAWSYYERGAVPSRTRLGINWLLGPNDPGVLPIEDWQSLSDYQLCFWYALEIERRQKEYHGIAIARGIRSTETMNTELKDWIKFERLCRELGLPIVDGVAAREAHRRIVAERHNPNRRSINADRAELATMEEEVWRRIEIETPSFRESIVTRYES